MGAKIFYGNLKTKWVTKLSKKIQFVSGIFFVDLWVGISKTLGAKIFCGNLKEKWFTKLGNKIRFVGATLFVDL